MQICWKREVVAHDIHMNVKTHDFDHFVWQLRLRSAIWILYLLRTHAHTRSNEILRYERTHTHTPHICETHTHMCVIARVHSTHKARTHTATAGEKTSLFLSICVLDLIIWYVSMCVCSPIEVMAMNKDRKITTKMKWNEHKSQSSMAQEKMIYRLECLFSYSEW